MTNEEHTALFADGANWGHILAKASSRPSKKGTKMPYGYARLPAVQANENCEASATRAGRVKVECVYLPARMFWTLARSSSHGAVEVELSRSHGVLECDCKDFECGASAIERVVWAERDKDMSSISSGNRIFSSVSYGERPHHRRSR